MSQCNRDEEANIMRNVRQLLGWVLWVILMGIIVTVYLWMLLHAGFNVG